MRVTTSICRALLAAITAGFAVTGCANDNPPHTAPRASEGETVALKAAKAPPVEEPPPAPAPEPPKPAKPPESQELRYGPKNYALPAGCGPAGVKFSCNPITNAGCRADADEVCDDDDHEAFGCDPDSDNLREGAECNDKDGPSCGPGLTCDTPNDSEPRGFCRKFCCTKADCPPSTKCVALDREFGTLGVCK